VIPYCICSENRAWVLLGRERADAGWHGSRKWSAFAGSSLPDEAAWETASREYWEESLGVVDPASGRWSSQANNHMRDALREGDFDISIFMRFHTRMRGRAKTHLTYVKRVPFSPLLSQRFSILRDVATRLRSAQRSIDAALKSLPDTPPFFRPGTALSLRGQSVTVAAVHSVELCADGATVTVSLSVVEAVEAAGERQTIVHGLEPRLRAPVALYKQIHSLREQLTSFVQSLPRELGDLPAMDVQFDATGTVCSVRAKEEFLEKECVRLWSVDALRGIITRPDVAKRVFRHSFIPALNVALEYIDRARPRSSP
tara:strand:+ start:1114 stop:2055 length:942 start_codon:yes stop_codon:yes gene_type:complete